MEEERVKYPVRAAERVLTILQCFDGRHTRRSYLEIAETTGIPPSTAFKLVQMLVDHGFLEPDQQSERYRIGPEAFRIGSLYLADRSLVEIADPLLDRLSSRLGLLVSLGVRDSDNSVTLLIRSSVNVVGITRPIGERYPIYLSALGKALLLDMDDHELERLFSFGPPRIPTPKSITCAGQLCQDLQEARRRGYTIDDEGSYIGIYCVGCPIRDHRGQIVAAISVTGVKAAVLDRVPEIAAETRQTAEQISRSLGYHSTEKGNES